MGKIVFITGTDTGAGKTVLTALLLAHLRAHGINAFGMKPFCSGGRSDARLLFELSEREVPLEMINPFHFTRPLAPMLAARMERRHVMFKDVVARVRRLQRRCDLLLVEGAGGLLAPLGEGYTLRDLMGKLGGTAILTATNKLGVINHVLLSMEAMKSGWKLRAGVVLMGQRGADASKRTNAELLRELLPSPNVWEVPFLQGALSNAAEIRRYAKQRRNLLDRIVQSFVLPSANGFREDIHRGEL